MRFYLFFICFLATHVLFAQTSSGYLQGDDTSPSSFCYHRYTIEKDMLSNDLFRIKKDGLPVGRIEKEPISITETWEIKNSIGETVGKLQKEPVSLREGYAIKTPYGERIGKVEKAFLGNWEIQFDYGKTLNFDSNLTNQQNVFHSNEDRIKVKKSYSGNSYMINTFGECKKGNSILDPQTPLIDPVSSFNRKDKQEESKVSESIKSPFSGISNYNSAFKDLDRDTNPFNRSKSLINRSNYFSSPTEHLNSFNSMKTHSFTDFPERRKSTLDTFDSFNHIGSSHTYSSFGSMNLFDE